MSDFITTSDTDWQLYCSEKEREEYDTGEAGGAAEKANLHI